MEIGNVTVISSVQKALLAQDLFYDGLKEQSKSKETIIDYWFQGTLPGEKVLKISRREGYMGSLLVLNNGPTDLILICHKNAPSDPPDIEKHRIKAEAFIEVPRTALFLGISNPPI